MADEDVILEARKLVPHYTRQISWSAEAKLWQVVVPELPGCTAQGDSAASANRAADQVILHHLLDLGGRTTWPLPRKK